MACRFYLVAWLFSLLLVQDSRAETKKLLVGVIAPLSGPAASMGQSLEGSFRMRQWPHLELRYEDDQCDAKKGLTAYRKLSEQGVSVFYIACSGSILAVAPSAKQNHQLVVSSYAGSAAIRETGTEVIRFDPDAVSVAQGMIEFLPASGIKADEPLGLLYEEQDYASSLAALLKKSLGSRIVAEQTYLGADPTFRPQILKLQASKATHILYIPVSDVAARVVLKEMREISFKKPIMSEVNLCDYPFTLSDFNLHGSCLTATLEGEAYESFKRDYAKNIGRPSQYPFYDAITFDMASIFDQFASTATTDRSAPALIAYIMQGVHGPISSYRFTPDGEVIEGWRFMKLKSF